MSMCVDRQYRVNQLCTPPLKKKVSICCQIDKLVAYPGVPSIKHTFEIDFIRQLSSV